MSFYARERNAPRAGFEATGEGRLPDISFPAHVVKSAPFGTILRVGKLKAGNVSIRTSSTQPETQLAHWFLRPEFLK